jgi:hypothetical protein
LADLLNAPLYQSPDGQPPRPVQLTLADYILGIPSNQNADADVRARILLLAAGAPVTGATDQRPAAPSSRPNYAWAELMARSFSFSVLTCKHCGGRLRFAGNLTDPRVIGPLLKSLGISSEAPKLSPPRAPPTGDLFDAA